MPDGFDYAAKCANSGAEALIDALVDDGFFTKEQGAKLQKFYDIYYVQTDELKKQGKAQATVARGPVDLISEIPRPAANKSFDLELIDILVERQNKMEARLKKVENKAKSKNGIG